VPSSRTFQRLELALGALGVTAAALMFVITLDAFEFHAAALWHVVSHLDLRHLDLACAAVATLGAIDAIVILRAGRSLARQVLGQRAFLRALPVRGELVIDGHPVRLFPGRRPQAFCAGLLRPAVYLSEGIVRDVGGAELRAIVAHEEHHRARRDPLRLLLARVLSDAFRPLPRLATLADRQAALADLAADAAAVRALGDAGPLAAALVRFDDTASGVAPERIDQLVREYPAETVSPWLLVAAGLALAGIAAVAAQMLLVGWHPDLTVPVVFELAALAVASVPAYLAARRAEACLRPAV
jgi:Peptidase family M48